MIQFIKTQIVSLMHPDLVMLNPILRIRYYLKYSSDGFIVMLHRVGKSECIELGTNKYMKLLPDLLEQFIIRYKRAGFEFISLDELYEKFKTGKAGRRFVVMTLDDGYEDNFSVAYPIFKKHNIPFCVYVATDYPDRKAKMWWYALSEYILSKESIVLNDGHILPLGTLEQKEEAFDVIRWKIVHQKSIPICDYIKSLIPDFDVDIDKYAYSEAMSWEQIKIMSKDTLCTIGGHTMSHPVLSSLAEQDVRNEIKGGMEKLEAHIGKPVEHFAYPFGSSNEASEREYDIARSFGFKTIVTTISSPISIKNSSCNRLTRISLANNNF